jgi:excinuclease UvrABC ATPase subunit
VRWNCSYRGSGRIVTSWRRQPTEKQILVRGARHNILQNLDVIKTADYVIDLGPEGGHKGGRLLACGTPEQVAKTKSSHTGRFLKSHL